MENERAALAHVLWIGGGPQAGKTTLSRLLAGKYDLRIYNLDLHGPPEDGTRRGEAEVAFAALSMDARWALPTVAELVARSIQIWEERFVRVTEDLLALPRIRPIIAEGPGALPWCVAPLLSRAEQAIFLVPSAERREIVSAERWGRGQTARYPGIVERERALRKVRERDALMDELTFTACEQLGLRCERMDGSRGLDASLGLLEDQFGALLPVTVNA